MKQKNNDNQKNNDKREKEVEVLVQTAQGEDVKAQSHQSGRLLVIASEVQLFRTPGGESYAKLPIGTTLEAHPIRSRAVKDWLTLMYMERHGGIPNKTAIENVLSGLEAKSRFRAAAEEIYLRVAYHQGAVFLDLNNSMGEVVKIDELGWTVLSESPVNFRRSSGMLPLPTPEHGGSLDELCEFLNLGTEKDRTLVTAWLVGTLHPTGPYPVLALHGEKGSGKSTFTRYLRALVDPNEAPAPVQPRESGDLTIKAQHNWIVAFDNMSSMPRWLSDALCRLSTGAGDSKRLLYSDSEQVVFAAKRPIILNGIEEIATAGDLLDRTMIVTLPVISEEKRTSEAELNAAFEAARPRLLGALLDAVSGALRNRERVKLERKPRMVDFAVWATAAEEALGWKTGTFEAAYTGNRDEATSLEIEASPVARAVRDFVETGMRTKNEWIGTATELLKELANKAEDGDTHHYSWPKNGQALSGALTRTAGALRTIGIEIVKSKSGSRAITLRKVEQAQEQKAVVIAKNVNIHYHSDEEVNENYDDIPF